MQVRVTDPECFCGVSEFRRQATHLIALCQTSMPRDASNPVRLPGHSALARKRQYVVEGVPVAEGILSQLREWSEKLGVPMPEVEDRL